MIDPDVEEFLSHYGKKGMKWGQRTAKPTTTTTPAQRKQNLERVSRIHAGTLARQQAERQQRNRRIAIGVGAVAATAVIATVLARRGRIPIKEARRLANPAPAKKIINTRGSLQMASDYVKKSPAVRDLFSSAGSILAPKPRPVSYF